MGLEAAIREVIRGKDTAAIYISHDLAVVAQLADRIMVLKDGHLVEEGDATKLLEKPRETYTRELISVRLKRKKTAPEDLNRTTLLKIEDITAGYKRGVTVLKNISLHVKRGSTVAVVGESGSGKSTLARVITGLLPPTKGRIRFGGISVGVFVAFVLPGPGPFDHLWRRHDRHFTRLPALPTAAYRLS